MKMKMKSDPLALHLHVHLHHVETSQPHVFFDLTLYIQAT